MSAALRIALGIVLGLLLATLPFIHYWHYRLGGAHVGAHSAVDTGGSHASHTH